MLNDYFVPPTKNPVNPDRSSSMIRVRGTTVVSLSLTYIMHYESVVSVHVKLKEKSIRLLLLIRGSIDVVSKVVAVLRSIMVLLLYIFA